MNFFYIIKELGLEPEKSSEQFFREGLMNDGLGLVIGCVDSKKNVSLFLNFGK